MKEAPIKVMIAGGGGGAGGHDGPARACRRAHIDAARHANPRVRLPAIGGAEPFGHGEARRYDVVRMASDHRAAVHIAGIKGVDNPRHRVVTWDGRELPFDVNRWRWGTPDNIDTRSVIVQGPGYTDVFGLSSATSKSARYDLAFAVPRGILAPAPS